MPTPPSSPTPTSAVRCRVRGKSPPLTEPLVIEGESLVIGFHRHPRARRYVLSIRRDGTLRMTLPRFGTIDAAREFLASRTEWILATVRRFRTLPPPPVRRQWQAGTEVWLRGSRELIHIDDTGGHRTVRLGNEECRVMTSAEGDVRRAVEAQLRRLAARELPARTLELAALHGSPVRKICIRNQRTRWGSCSRRGTISLNWRLIHVPAFVRDYIILHELMHFRHMNHSRAFWAAVEQVCPDYREAELWLKRHRGEFSF